MLKITKDNYDLYKRTFEIIWRYYIGHTKLDPNHLSSPSDVLTNWETKSKSLALRGLKEGINNVLTMISGLPDKNKMDLDNILKSAGLQPLNRLISSVKDIPAKVIKRGKIKNLDEYYIVRDAIADTAYEISETDRQQLEIILFKYENDFSKTKNSR